MIGTPRIISMLILPFTKIGEPLFYRISSVTMALEIATLSLTLVYASPQMKNLIRNSFKRNEQVNFIIQKRNKPFSTLTKNEISLLISHFEKKSLSSNDSFK